MVECGSLVGDSYRFVKGVSTTTFTQPRPPRPPTATATATRTTTITTKTTEHYVHSPIVLPAALRFLFVFFSGLSTYCSVTQAGGRGQRELVTVAGSSGLAGIHARGVEAKTHFVLLSISDNHADGVVVHLVETVKVHCRSHRVLDQLQHDIVQV